MILSGNTTRSELQPRSTGRVLADLDRDEFDVVGTVQGSSEIYSRSSNNWLDVSETQKHVQWT